MNTQQSNQNRPTKQPGYTWGTPCIIVENCQKAIDTYTNVFGFTVDNTMNGKDGAINFAKLSYKDFGLHISDGSCSPGNQKFQTPKMSGTPSPISIYLYNDNVEDVTQKAKTHGLTIIQEPTRMFWGDQMSILLDQDGYIWNFAKNVGDFDPSLMPC